MGVSGLRNTGRYPLVICLALVTMFISFLRETAVLLCVAFEWFKVGPRILIVMHWNYMKWMTRNPALHNRQWTIIKRTVRRKTIDRRYLAFKLSRKCCWSAFELFSCTSRPASFVARSSVRWIGSLGTVMTELITAHTSVSSVPVRKSSCVILLVPGDEGSCGIAVNRTARYVIGSSPY